jgi:hypothetical protein
MKKIWTRELALNTLLNINGKYKAGTCREDDKWYKEHDLLDLREFIFQYTDYVDHQSLFHLRMLCLKLGLKSLPHCLYCENIPDAIYTMSYFRDTCNNKICRSKFRSYTSTMIEKYPQLYKGLKFAL